MEKVKYFTFFFWCFCRFWYEVTLLIKFVKKLSNFRQKVIEFSTTFGFVSKIRLAFLLIKFDTINYIKLLWIFYLNLAV